MKARILGAFSLFCLLAQAQTHQEGDYFSDRFFLKMKESSIENMKSVKALLKDLPLLDMKKASISKEMEGVYHIQLVQDYEKLDSIIALLNEDTNVIYAEREPLYKLFFTPNDLLYPTQWNLAKIQADQAWNLSLGCANVKVAVTDDGFLMNHEDLANQWHINSGEIIGNGIDDDANGFIDDWRGWDAANNDNNPAAFNPTNSYFTHGTHVAGIVAGHTNNSLGVAAIGYQCKMIPVKIGRDLDGALWGAFQGLDYAVNASGCDVINMSWGGGGWSATYQALFNIAKTRGIIAVAAAGNSNTSTPMYPASYNHVISVAASGTTDARANFTNYGSTIDVTAPGVAIPSCLAGATNSYGNLSGTSMASPLVAGLCALMKCYNPLPADSIEACLKKTCDNIDAQNPSFIGKLGAGRINAFQALQCVTKKPKSDFLALDTIQCIGKTVRYTARSFGIPTLSYQWIFPGGTPATSTTSNPVVTYNTNGYKSATLITCNSLGCDTITKTNVVNVDTPRAWLTNRRYTSYNANTVIMAVQFKGNPPFNVTLSDGTNNFTQTNIRSNPYFFSVVPQKDTSLISILSFSDSLCVGNKLGLDTIVRVTSSSGGTNLDCDTTNLNTGKVLHLDFNGNTQDKSGNGNHATNFGATPVAGKAGVANTAYRFDGVNDYMQVSHSTSLSPSSVTMTAMIKPRSFNADPCMGNEILTKGYDLPGGSGRYCMRYSPLVGNCTAFGDTMLNNFYPIFKGYSGCATSVINDTPKVKTNRWYCLVMSYGNDTIKTYIDGILRHSCYFTGSLGSNTFDLFIGKHNYPSGTFPFWLSADVDDIRIYNRVLSPSEVKGYCGTCNVSPPMFPCDTPSLLACYPFLGNSNDSVGSNHGTVNGANLIADRHGNSNSAYNFDGVNDDIQINATLGNFNTSNYTISFWIKMSTNDNSTYRIMEKRNICNLHNFWGIVVNNGKIAIEIDQSNASDYLSVTSKTQINDGNWHQITFTRSVNDLSVFIDGKFDTMKLGSMIINSDNSFILKLGTSVCLGLDGTKYFSGQLDDIKIYKRALSASEISSLHAKPFSCSCSSIQPPPCDTAKKYTYTQCLHDSIQISASIGSKYQWSPLTGLSNDTIRNPKVSASNNQRYLVAYKSAKNCQLVDTIDLTVKAAAIYPKMADQLICSGDSVQMTIPIYATNIQWSPNTAISSTSVKSPYFFPTVSSTYYLKFTDSFGCVHSDTFTIAVKTCCNARAKFSLSDSMICFGNVASISNLSTGIITNYSWQFGGALPSSSTSPNPPNISFPSGGIYIVQLIVSNTSCRDTMIKNIQVIRMKPFAGLDSITCLYNLNLEIGESGISDWTYSWSPTNFLSDPSKANPTVNITGSQQTYIVTARDKSTGCEGKDTVLIGTTTSVNTITSTHTLCQGDSIFFFTKYLKDSGSYTHMVKKRNSDCDSLQILQHIKILKVQRINRPTQYYCQRFIDKNGLVHDTSYSQIDTLKSKLRNCDSIITTTHIHINIKKREYRTVKGCKTVRLRNRTYFVSTSSADSLIIKSPKSGCDSLNIIYNIIVFPGPKPLIRPSVENPVLNKQNVVLTVSGGIDYLWNPSGAVDSSIISGADRIGSSTTYTVIVRDKDSCIDSAKYTVRDTCTYGMPNVFSPNGDNLNDVIMPLLNDCAEVTTFIIMNRWGEKMFETNKFAGWDGYYRGELAPIANYTYYLELNTTLGKRILKGSFSLVR